MAFVRLVALAAMASLASAFHPLLAGQPAAPRGPAAWSPVVMRAVEDRPVVDAEVVEVVAAAAPEPSTRVAVPVVSVPQVPVESSAAAKVLPAGSKRARARQALSKMPLLHLLMRQPHTVGRCMVMAQIQTQPHIRRSIWTQPTLQHGPT